MNPLGIVITGTSGSGKSAIVKELCRLTPQFSHVMAVTTRDRRADDTPGTYDYISTKDFSKFHEEGQFLIATEYRQHQYAIRHSDVEAVKGGQKIPVLMITPESAARLNKDALNEFANKGIYLSFFVDALDEILDERLKERAASANRALVVEQRKVDREYKDTCHYSLTNLDLQSTVKLVASLWDTSYRGGILPNRLISLMLNCGMLLDNAAPENVSGASYDLSLGDEYFYGGSIHQLTDSEPILLIEPYDYAIVTSHESSNLPRDVCARFDLSVSLFCQGVILSNGPQIDPGFRGPLFCLLFNTSSSPVLLKRRQHYATLEFHKMVEPTYSYAGRYQAKNLLHYLPSNAARGAINELKKELEQVRKESQTLQNTMWAMLALILALIAAWFSLK